MKEKDADKPIFSQGKSTDDGFVCPNCGKKRSNRSQDGSPVDVRSTGNLCQCPPDPAFADGKMGARFRKLKQGGDTTMFTSFESEARTGSFASIDLAPGATIGGAYKIIKLIARGGMGEVYLATHDALAKKCALKVIPPEQVTEIGWQRFQLEAKAVARLNHVNLVRVTDLGIHEGCLPFYAMDFVDGQNLADLLSEHGPMPMRAAIEIFVQVCDGVECAHSNGILHRDLKPGNIILVSGKSAPKLAKVLDFGLAKLTRHDRSKQSLTLAGDVFGSPAYMSPEQCRGEKLDNRSDIYALGCTLFECLTGRTPFVGDVASTIIFSHLEAEPPTLAAVAGAGKFPPSLEIVMAKLLRKNRDERYQTLSQVKADLELVAQGKNILPDVVSHYKKSAAPAEKADEIEKPAAPASLVNVAGWTSGFLLLAVVASGLFYFGFEVNKMEQNKKTAPVKIVELVDNAAMDKPAPPAGPKVAPSCRVEKGADGHNYLVFKFAPGLKLGIFMDTHAPGFHLRPTGEVRWIEGWHPAFKPTKEFLLDRANLDIFKPDHISGLDLSGEARDQIDSDLMQHIAGLRGLRFLNLQDGDIGDPDVAQLKNLTNLTNLSVSATEVSGGALAKLPFVRNLEWLGLRNCSGASDVLRVLKGSDKIKELYLNGDNLTTADFKIIGTFSNLRFLNINNSGMTGADLMALKPLTKLKTLHAEDCVITQEALQALKIMRKNGLQYLTCSAEGLSPQKVRELKEIIPQSDIRLGGTTEPERGMIRDLKGIAE